MEEGWYSVEEDIISSSSSCDSDKIDSEVEAELFSVIHYEKPLSLEKCFTSESNENDHISTNVSQNTIDNNCDGNSNRSINFNRSNFTSNSRVSHFHTESASENNNDKNCQRLFKSQKRRLDVEDSHSIVCSDNSEIDKSSTPKDNSLYLNNKSEDLQEYCSKNIKSPKKFKPDISSSDSDNSVIWTEPATTDLKTNLLNDRDVILLTSDDSDSLVVSSLKQEASLQKNPSACNLTRKRNFKDLWHINEEDLYRRKKHFIVRRYHSLLELHCSNCNKKGHTAKACPVPKVIKCFFCGGDHLGNTCRNRICSRCFKFGHGDKNCYKSVGYCSHCNMKGHHQKNCPDIWRRYHLTTESSDIVQSKPVNQKRTIYCYNCGWPGHFGAKCKEPRTSRGPFPTWPSVISYDNPEKLLKERYAGMQNGVYVNKEQLPDQQYSNHQKQNSPRRKNIRRNYSFSDRRKARELKGENMKNSQQTEENTNNSERNLSRFQENTNNEDRNSSRFQENRKFRVRDFPRTQKKNRIITSAKDIVPKINVAINPCPVSDEDPLPDSVHLHMQEELLKRRRNIKRKMRRKQQKIKCTSSGAKGIKFNIGVQI